MAEAQQPEVKRADPPAWVVDVPVDLMLKNPPAASDGGMYRLLVERQCNVSDGSCYVHLAKLLQTGNAVQDESSISIGFDPAYETLTFHRLVVHRDGRNLDKLAKQEIKLLQRETSLDRHLYDGRLSAVLILEDIRVGDVLEYAYTLRGRNPIFGKHFTSSFYGSTHEPIRHLRYRLLWPSGPAPIYKTFGKEWAPQVTSQGDSTEYLWERRDIAAVASDGDLPSWYDPWESTQITDFESWAAVARWAADIYQVPTSVPEELAAVLQKIRLEKSEEARILAALRYVQDNIRYLGIEVGENSHKPYPIGTILARRFGDCKDKALLLCTMLRQLGFEAYPALVGTSERRQVVQWLPSSRPFDHLVVQLRFQRTSIWLDPTDRNQGGSLQNIFFPDYGSSLVVAPDTTGLTEVRVSGYAETSREIVDSYDFQDFDGAAILRVRSTFRGNAADDQRTFHADSSLDTIQKLNINFYADIHPHLKEIDVPSFRDDRATNVLTEDESYYITDFWTPVENEKKPKIRGTFYSQYMQDVLHKPSRTVRSMPYRIPYPQKVAHLIEINFPWEPKLEKEHVVVDDPAFRFEYSAGKSGSKFALRYAYESKAEYVAAEAIPKYMENFQKMRRLLSYQLTLPADWAAKPVARTEPAEKPTDAVPAKAHVEDATTQAAGVQPVGRWLVGTAILGLIVFGGLGLAVYAVRSRATKADADESMALHRCSVCGETEQSNPALEFRVARDGADYCHRHRPPPPLPPTMPPPLPPSGSQA